jgi:hypothetical protein
MQKTIAWVVGAALLATGFAFARVSDEAKLDERIITEGEFAILYCTFIHAKEPKDGWTAEAAIAALHSLKVYHPDGWRPSVDLVESVMVELIRFAGVEIVTAYPDRKVTVRRANAVFHTFRSRFFKLHPEYRTSTGEPATFIEYEGNPGFEMSPASF